MKQSGVILWPLARPLLFFILSLLFASTAAAHGGGTPRLVNEPDGPYWLSVWTSPDPARAERPLHVTVGLTEPGTGRQAGPPVLGAEVTVSLFLSGEAGPAISEPAPAGANRLLYEVDVILPEPGRWTVQVDADGPAGSASVAFDLEIAEPGGANWLLWGGGGALLLAALFVLSGRRR